MRDHGGYEDFAPGFFDRADESADVDFYRPLRLVQHIDARAIAAIGDLYAEHKVQGRVLDLMSSWVSHFTSAPEELCVLGMNAEELAKNPQAHSTVLHDLNTTPTLPFADHHFDDVVCAVSVDYLTQPIEVFAEVKRVLRPGGRFICTFSNRCFPTKAIRGWLMASDSLRCEIVATYFQLVDGFDEPHIETRVRGGISDPLYAVWATVSGSLPPGTDL